MYFASACVFSYFILFLYNPVRDACVGMLPLPLVLVHSLLMGLAFFCGLSNRSSNFGDGCQFDGSQVRF